MSRKKNMCIPEAYVIADLSEIFLIDEGTVKNFLRYHPLKDYGTERTYFKYNKHQLIKDFRDYIKNGKTLH